MKHFFVKAMCLFLFDGGASGASGGAGEGGAETGGTNGGTDVAQQSKTGEVVYGKQTAAPDAGEQDQRASFKDLINGDYKADFDAEVQRIVGERLKKVKDQGRIVADQGKALNAQQPILDALSLRYGTAPGDIEALRSAVDRDNSLWEQAAEEAGMSVEQYRQYQQMQQENARLRAAQEDYYARQRSEQQLHSWMDQAEAMKQDPLLADFDLPTEINTNPDFLALLQRGVSVEQAYKVLHMDDFLSKATAQAEKTVTDNIRARGARPQENGAAPKSAVVVKDDVSKLTPADRAEIARRAAMGETITFN